MNYLSSDYLHIFRSTLNSNICDKITNIKDCPNAFQQTTQHGYKSVIVRLFELIRYVGIQYSSNYNKDYKNARQFQEISNAF